jgi:hypothetical protein
MGAGVFTRMLSAAGLEHPAQNRRRMSHPYRMGTGLPGRPGEGLQLQAAETCPPMTDFENMLSSLKLHASLGFCHGSELPDPEGLLEGSGQLFRHVRLDTSEDLARPALRVLLEHAVRHCVPPPRG